MTHAVDMAQRAIDARGDRRRRGLTLRAPADPSLAPPGYYMLHVVNGDGVPSLAAWVRLDPAAPAPPALPGRPGPPIVAPLPAPPPAASGRPAPLRLASLSPRAVRRGRGAVVVVRLRASRDVSALVTLAGPRGGPTAARRVALRAGHALARAIAVPPALRGSPTVRLRAVVRTAGGARLTHTATVRLPPAR